MCYAIPGRLIDIKDNIGIVDYFGEKRRVLIDYSDVRVGDYVYAQGGILINKISEREAQEILDAWREAFFALQKVDQALAKVNKASASRTVLEILQKAGLNRELKKEELLFLYRLKEKDELRLLYETANNIRQKGHKNACCVHGIIEFSNYCRNNCFYCGIRRENSIKRYRMSVEEIVGIACYAAKELGFKALVIQSGEDFWYNENRLITIVKEIRKLGVLVFLSIGQRSPQTYRKLFEAGARAALLRFESSNRDIFANLRPDACLEERLELIRYLKDLGYVLATGFLIGLPQETEDDIINNILLTMSLGPDMYSFGPFIPAQGTPLENSKKVSKDTVLKIMAICRLVDRTSKILVTTALETLDREAKKEALLSGANSLMINVTPKKYRGLYCIYDNRAGQDGDIIDNIKEVIGLLSSIGRAPTDLGI